MLFLQSALNTCLSEEESLPLSTNSGFLSLKCDLMCLQKPIKIYVENFTIKTMLKYHFYLHIQ